MRLLIAHGDAAARAAFRRVAERVAAHGLDIVESCDGKEALELLLSVNAPQVALVDWELPELDGLELCRIVNQFYEARPPYVVLVAGRAHDLAAGLDAGASDCVHAPVDAEELRARLAVGYRIARLLGPREAAADTVRDVVRDDAYDDTHDAAPNAPHDVAHDATHAVAAASLAAELRPADADDEDDGGVLGAATLESVIAPD